MLAGGVEDVNTGGGGAEGGELGARLRLARRRRGAPLVKGLWSASARRYPEHGGTAASPGSNMQLTGREQWRLGERA